MSKPLLILLALGGGFAGGFASQAVFGPSSASTDREAAPAVGDLAEIERPEDDSIAALQGEVAALRATLNAMELQFSERRDLSPAPTFDPESSDLMATISGMDSELLGDPLLDTRIQAVIEQREEERREEQRERWAEQSERRLDRQMEQLVAELGLDEYQATEMRKVLGQASTTRTDFFTEMRESGNWDREAMRDTMTEIRQTTLDSLSTVLSAEQLASYEAMPSDMDFGRGGRGPGGGGPGGGGGRPRGGGNDREF